MMSVMKARPWPLWDALVKAGRRWAEPFGVEVRRHHLNPEQVECLAKEARYCLDLVHGRLVKGQVGEEAIATVSFSFAEVRSPAFSDVFRDRMRAGVGTLLDVYAEGRRVWTGKAPRKAKRFWGDRFDRAADVVSEQAKMLKAAKDQKRRDDRHAGVTSDGRGTRFLE